MAEYLTETKFDIFLKEETQHHKDADDRVRAVEVQVAAVGQQVAAVGMQSSASADRLEKLYKTVYGNGDPGMDEQIRQLYAWMVEQKETAKALAEDQKEESKWFRGESLKWILGIAALLFGQWAMNALGLVK